MLTREKLMRLELRNFTGNHLPSAEDVLSWFQILEAGWIHDGNPSRPHAKLHSGKCSNGFFLCKRVLKFPNLREILAACMVKELDEAGLGHRFSAVDGVFGSPYSSITLAADIGRILGVPNYIVEKGLKDPETGENTMVFKNDDPVPGGSILLQVEELITTKDSARLTMHAIARGNVEPVIFSRLVGVLVNRPNIIDRDFFGRGILVPFIEEQVGSWDPGAASCPYCSMGSKPIPPKAHGNWAQLVAKY